jgi:hypothetical protein
MYIYAFLVCMCMRVVYVCVYIAHIGDACEYVCINWFLSQTMLARISMSFPPILTRFFICSSCPSLAASNRQVSSCCSCSCNMCVCAYMCVCVCARARRCVFEHDYACVCIVYDACMYMDEYIRMSALNIYYIGTQNLPYQNEKMLSECMQKSVQACI